MRVGTTYPVPTLCVYYYYYLSSRSSFLQTPNAKLFFFFQLTWSTLSIGWLGDVIDIEILVSGFYCTFHFWRFLSAFVLTPAPQASRLSHKVSKYAMQMHITWIGNLVCIESGHKFENGRKWVLRPDLYCKLIRWPLGNSQNVMFATRQGIQILSIIASIKRVVSCVI